MDAFQKEIDERTNLTSSNKFELLLFRLGNPEGTTDKPGELYGINVFKIREIVPMMDITAASLNENIYNYKQRISLSLSRGQENYFSFLRDG